MLALFRKGVLLSILFALCFSLASCDSGGDNDSPAWVGKWEVISVAGSSPEGDFYWELTEDKQRIGVVGEGCFYRDIIGRDGNTLTIEGEEGDGVGEFLFDASGETMTVTVVDPPPGEGNAGNEIKLRKVESTPVDLENCELGGF